MLKKLFHPKNILNFYIEQVTIKNPIKTKIFTGFLFGSLGDMIC